MTWNTTLYDLGAIEYRIDDGGWIRVDESVPRKHHVIVVDGLPVGSRLCLKAFSTIDGKVSEEHAIRLLNAMNAFDAPSRTYSANLVMVSSFPQNRPMLEAGVRLFAKTLFDATDGWVRAGSTWILYSYAESAITTVSYRPIPPRLVHDVAFQTTSDHTPPFGPPAYAFFDGIQYPGMYIAMNVLFEAGPASITGFPQSVQEVGNTLTHEFGHYAFGMRDMYLIGSCFDAKLGYSIMAGDRSTTEFDDEIHRCPTGPRAGAPVEGDFTPSWTKMRERFPEIPPRTVIDLGPENDGGAFDLVVLDLAAP